MMETFRVDLSPLHKQSKYQPYFFAILGIMHIIMGILNLSRYDKYSFHGWIFILSGIVFLFGSYYHKNYSSKYFFEMNNDFIQIKQSIKNARKIEWSGLKEIHIKPISLELHLQDNTVEELSLGNVGYKNVIDIKSKLLEIAKEKNIRVN